MSTIKATAEVEAGSDRGGDWKGFSSGQGAHVAISSHDRIPDGIGTAANCTVRAKGGSGGSQVCWGPRPGLPVPSVSAATSAASARWLCLSL